MNLPIMLTSFVTVGLIALAVLVVICVICVIGVLVYFYMAYRMQKKLRDEGFYD